MSKVRIIIGVFAACFVVGGATTSAASAACGGVTGEWCITGSPLMGSVELTEESNVTEDMVLSIPALKFKIECKVLKGKKALLEAPNKISAESLIFEECSTVEGAPKCELEETKIASKPIQTEGVVKRRGTIEAEATLEPVAGSFANIKIKTGKGCALSGTQAVTGKARLIAPTAQEEKLEQELDANTGSGEIKVGADEATLKGKTKIKLKSGSNFSFR